jgi:CRISPR-associated exonuclease Cas4
LLLQKLGEMRGAIVKGEAHRNHNRPGKCIHCSRRSGCPERLA